MPSSDSNDFDTNGLEKIQYKSTTTSEDGVTETKILTIFFEEEIKDKVPAQSMLDDSWQLVVDENEQKDDENDLNDDSKELQTKPTTKQDLAKLAFQSPIPTISKLSISSKMPTSKLLIAKSA